MSQGIFNLKKLKVFMNGNYKAHPLKKWMQINEF